MKLLEQQLHIGEIMKKEKIRNVPSIEELRAAGHKVRVYHARVFSVYNGHHLLSKREMERIDEYAMIYCKGGYTRIDVTTLSGKDYSAKFNVPADRNFNRKLGIRVCIGKILKQMEGGR
jgi:hypothetical protein